MLPTFVVKPLDNAMFSNYLRVKLLFFKHIFMSDIIRHCHFSDI